MITVREPVLLADEDRLLCRTCREPVEWVGRWRHTFAPFQQCARSGATSHEYPSYTATRREVVS